MRVSKRRGKTRTWLIGCKNKNKNVVASSGNVKRELEKKRYMIVHNTEKEDERMGGSAKGKLLNRWFSGSFRAFGGFSCHGHLRY